MIDLAVNQEEKINEYTPPEVGQAIGLAERDQRSLIAIIEGELNIKRVNPKYEGINIYTFYTSSQLLEELSCSDLVKALDQSIDNPENNIEELRNIIYNGSNLDILINSVGGTGSSIMFFEELIDLVATMGGRVSSYATTNAMSATAIIWQSAQERYILSDSVLLWHLPVFNFEGKNTLFDAVKYYEKKLEEINPQDKMYELVQKSISFLKNYHKTYISQFKTIVSQMKDSRLNERLIDKFLNGDDVIIPSSELIKSKFATGYEDVECMKRALYNSLGVQPYTKLEPLDEFFDNSAGEDEEIRKILTNSTNKEEKITHNYEKEKPISLPVKQPIDIYDRNNVSPSRLKQIVSHLCLATTITALVGISYFGFLAVKSKENLDTEMRPVMEEFCSDSYNVSLKTGPKVFEYKLNSSDLEKITVTRDMLNRKHVIIDSINYEKVCLR
ncbi:MAG: hypothetical protein Q8Q35_02940 [Nanoarchaeota archaeon]|nr:hypothetical protein [Nanoarchaeota archaeon]